MDKLYCKKFWMSLELTPCGCSILETFKISSVVRSQAHS